MDVVIKNTLASFDPSQAGWQFMWVILFVGLAGLGVAIERFLYIYVRCSSGRDKFLLEYGRLVADKKYEDAISFCGRSQFPIAAVLGSVLQHVIKAKKLWLQQAMPLS